MDKREVIIKAQTKSQKSEKEIQSEILLGLVLRDMERDVQIKKGSV